MVLIQTLIDAVRDHSRSQFCRFRIFAGVKFIHGFDKNFDPTDKMPGFHPLSSIECLVYEQRVAGIDGTSKDRLFPKITHYGLVGIEIHQRKMMSNDRVIDSDRVEMIDQPFDIPARIDVGGHYSVVTASSPASAA